MLGNSPEMTQSANYNGRVTAWSQCLCFLCTGSMWLGRHRDVVVKEHGERDGGTWSLNSGMSWTPSEGFLWCLCKVRGSTDGCCGCKRLKHWQVSVKWTLPYLKKGVFPKGIYLSRFTKARRSEGEEISPFPAVPLVYRGKDSGDDGPDVERLLLPWNLNESQKVETSEDELGPLSPLAAKEHLVAFAPDAWWNFGKV